MAKEKNPERVLNEWQAHPGIWDSDIILLQEVPHFAAGRPSIARTLAQAMGRHVVSAPSVANKDIDGLAIISRFPLTDFVLTELAHNPMVFHTRNRIAIAVTVRTPAGPLRVYNVHLDSRINSETRLKQIAPVIAQAAQWDGPRLIGGDFNTNYLRWVGNVLPVGVSFQVRALRKTMAEKAFTTALAGSGPTSDFLGLHLDWLYTRDVQVVATAVEPLRFTDHHAVRVTLAPLAMLASTGSAVKQ
jgi:endonuclease/exonuclease/phosphatase family metal-dependent hydrolase